MLVRALLLAGLLAGGQLAVDYIKQGYEIGKVVPPTRDINQLPMELGSWSGSNLDTNERIQEYLQARAGVDRIYRNAVGEEISAHVVWTDDYIKIHFPEQCYKESGWDHLSTKAIEVDLPGAEDVASTDIELEAGGNTVPARILTFNRDGRQTMVLYWFQMGDRYFFDRVSHRMLRREVCWGNTEWPPLVKVMLESPRVGQRAENHLRELAGEIMTWMEDS